MPELPDVEVYRRRLAAHEGSRVEDVTVRQSRVHRASPEALRSHLRGARLGRPVRHGKWLVAPLGDGALAMHFGMTGDLRTLEEGEAPRGLREVHGLGPDVLDLGADGFREALRRRSGMVKAALLDQSLVAGLGNVYADEALFQARIHPRTPLSALSDKDLRRLHRKVLHVARRAMEAEHPRRGGVRPEDVPGTWLLPHRGAGGACPRCGAALVAVEAGGRRGWACTACTPAP